MTFDYPPRYSGNDEVYTRELQSFLWQLSERLNVAMNALDSGTFSDTSSARKGAPAKTGGGTGSGGITPETKQAYEELRALIINTANYTSREIAVISGKTGTLDTAMENAQQDIASANDIAAEHWKAFEEYQKNTDGTISGLALKEDVESQFGSLSEQYTTIKKYEAGIEELQNTYDVELKALDAANAGFSNFQVSMEGTIRLGVIGFDTSTPIYGIAIGENVTTSVGHENEGKIYYEIEENKTMAFYTSNKVSFYVYGKEVAYMSNENLYINSANIINDVTVGDFKFSSSKTTGLTVKWSGQNG